MKTIITKRCNRCGNVKPVSEFYRVYLCDAYQSDCKDCMKEYMRNKYWNKKNDDVEGRVLNRPNTYISKAQHDLTFKIMTALGWTFNKKNGIWYNDEFGKDRNGVFHFRKMKKNLHLKMDSGV